MKHSDHSCFAIVLLTKVYAKLKITPPVLGDGWAKEGEEFIPNRTWYLHAEGEGEGERERGIGGREREGRRETGSRTSYRTLTPKRLTTLVHSALRALNHTPPSHHETPWAAHPKHVLKSLHTSPQASVPKE